MFWDAVTRGVRKEVNEQFAWLDEQVRRYNRETADKAISECAGLLASFAEGVRRDAIEKDRVLRGQNGKPASSGHDLGRWDGLARSEILARGEALRKALPSDVNDIAAANGPAPGVVLTEDQRRRVLIAIEDAELRIEGLELDNSKRSQVLAYVVAAKQLAEAPEPPADLIWQVVSRAADVLGLVGFFGMVLQAFL